MNTLPLEKKLLVLSALVEGNSINSIVRMTGVNKRTILRLLCEAGERASEILDREMVNIKSNFLQVDEIWTYVAKKQKQLKEDERNSLELGDQYVFVAIDAETKLIPTFSIGKRTGEMAHSFMRDLQYRISTRFQLSTDSFQPYFNAVDSVFGEDVDYGQVHKQYQEETRGEKRYSPSQIVSVTIRPLIGQPIRKHISTSYVERQNLTMRMQMRRFTRLTNAFSKKFSNLKAALALHFFHYNFMRIHQALRVTPAMEAHLTNRIWNWEDLLGLNIESKAA
jgi:IS1 family transposase